MALVAKNAPASEGDARDAGSNSRSERSPGEEDDNPIQYSCLENPMDRGPDPGGLQCMGSQKVGYN